MNDFPARIRVHTYTAVSPYLNEAGVILHVASEHVKKSDDRFALMSPTACILCCVTATTCRLAVELITKCRLDEFARRIGKEPPSAGGGSGGAPSGENRGRERPKVFAQNPLK